MGNLQFSLKANKIHKAFVKEIQGKSETKKCLCIPVDTMFEGRDGDLYINFDCIEKQSDYSTHFIKQQLSKDDYNALNDEQKKQIPIIGNLQNKKSSTDVKTEKKKDDVPVDDKMPF